MFTTAQKSLSDVLVLRRQQLALRVGVGLALTAAYGGILGWTNALTITTIYLVFQVVEILCFGTRRPWFATSSRIGTFLALTLLALNTAVYGASTLLLVWRLGPWGAVCSCYLLAGSILSIVGTTIGCSPAFWVSILPLFVYLGILPLNALGIAERPSLLVVSTLSVAGVGLAFSVAKVWRNWSLAKAAEISAVTVYVAERDANEKRLLRLAHQDALTGLANRTVLQSCLVEFIAEGAPWALLLVDLDGFKYVNDTLGHSAGDLVLREVAARIVTSARSSDTTVRLGGDEFALLLPDIADLDVAAEIADRIIASIAIPFIVDGQIINIGASVGVVIYPLHGDEAEQLFANADLALYQAKAEGRHCSRFYHPELRAVAQGKMSRDSELRRALVDREFELFYQPQIRVSDGTVAGAEALLRWRHPERGVLTPATFLSALENGLLAARVGEWVIETACQHAVMWREKYLPDFRIGVNLFGAQFRSGNLVESVMNACSSVNLPFEALEIEITENVIIRHEDEIISPLSELRALGVGISFDDYGTGYASLSLLTRYPLSRLKIDQRFTEAICDSPASAAIVRAVVSMAEALNFTVIAEGVETQEQAEALAEAGCSEVQGYHFGAPMTAAEFTGFLVLQQHRRAAAPAGLLQSI